MIHLSHDYSKFLPVGASAWKLATKSLPERENWGLQNQPRRGDLNLAQDVVLGTRCNSGLVPKGRLKRLEWISKPSLRD